ncbi:non-ribosomal peptide synthetase [Janthinobacterium sp. GMG1]|uniref:non-ribosomal peptide synthetase n=1 Tax=Janthinobacterium sp. GMG1 TaxID=3096007 RepID=UPI002ACA95DF|nr:non-ribosomal peptide synthetase [Janthinobacterium sp. GMG1]MDZ5634894.1 amino acid adenylation domain-containing protein [Janthinobacterium sp. GMG1]
MNDLAAGWPAGFPVAGQALSHGQRALWTFYKMAPGSPAYNMAFGAELAGPVDAALLRQAFLHAQQSYEVLGCVYAESEDGPRMLRRAAPGEDFAVDTTQGLGEAGARAYLARQADLPFVLEDDAPVRARLLVDHDGGEQRFYLMASMHHIAADFSSSFVFLETLFEAYETLRAGQALVLRPDALYREWLDEHSAMLAGPRGRRLEQFWRERLAGEPGPLQLATDFPRAASPAFEGAEVEFAIGAEEAQQLRLLAADQGVSLYGLLMAAYLAFMHRYTGEPEFLIGTPVAGHSGARYRNLLGFTLNAIPLRADCRADPAFADFLAACWLQLRSALKHQQYPLALMTEHCAPLQDGARTPLFRHMMTLVPLGARPALGRHVARELFATQRGAANDMNLRWQDSGAGLLGQWRYDTGLFHAASIERMVEHFRALLRDIVAHPQARLSQLRLAPRYLSQAQGQPLPADAAPTALQMFLRQVALHPQHMALDAPGGRLSYAQLDQAALRLAMRLQAAGVAAGDRVALLLARDTPLIVAMLAAWRAGAAYLCLDSGLPALRLRQMLDDAGIALTVGSGAAPALLEGRRWLDVDAAGAGADADIGAAWRAPLCHAELPAYIIYTSGSTGAPKGVSLSQGNLAAYVAGVMPRLALPPQASMSALSSLTADLGYTAWFGALLSGRTLRLIGDAQSADPEVLADLLEAQPLDCLKIVPSHLKALLSASRPERLLPLHCLVLGGEGLDPALVRRVGELRPGCRVVNHYGPTETTVGCLAQEAATAPTGLSAYVPVGAPLAGRTAYVLDARGELLPLGAIGELYLGGAGVAHGYLGRAGLSAERFIPDALGFVPGARLYRSGDRVRMLDGGVLEFFGRSDDQVKIRGFRVELGEVEAWLKARVELADAAVVARPLPGGDGLRLLASVVARDGAAAQAGLIDTLRAAMAQALPEALVPALWQVLARLPLLANGKVDRKGLPEPALAAPAAAAAAPRSAHENVLAEVWAEVLGGTADGVSLHDNFFASGGDSILGLQMIARARKRGLKLTPKNLFDHPSIAQLVTCIAAPAPAPSAPAVQLEHAAPFALAGLDAAQLAALQAARPGLQDAYPLSLLQTGLLFHSRLDAEEGGSGVYCNQLVLEVNGPFAPDAMRAAWQQAIDAHAILRTGFAWQGLEQPLQCVQTATTLDLLQLDWQALDAAGQDEALQAFCSADRKRGHVLEQAPLMRVALVRLAAQRWLLVWSRHHLIVDGWCSVMLLEEVLERYRASQAGGIPVLPRRPAYRDYIEWLGRRGGEAAGRAFWRARMAGVEGATPLPPLLPASRSNGVHQTLALHFGAEKAERLRQLARSSQVTLNTVMQAAWAMLLARYSGQQDVIFGVTSAGRPADLPGAQDMLGVFINTLPLRLQPRGALALGEFLRAVQQENVEIREYEQSPLVDIQKQAGHGGALFDTLMVFQNLPMAQGRRWSCATPQGPLQLHQRDNHEQSSYGLTIEVMPDQHIDVLFSADAGRLPGAQLKALMRHYQQLVEALAQATGSEVLAALPMLSAAQAHDLLEQGRNEGGPWRDEAVHAQFELQAVLHPDALALLYQDEALTYRALNLRANRLAHALLARGAGPEVRVGIAVERSVDMLAGLLAILKTGAAYVPLDPGYPAERLAYMIADSGMALLLTQASVLPRLALPAGLPVQLVEQPSALEHDPGHAPLPQQLAYVIYTSGSTGKPKGVGIAHQALSRHAQVSVGFFGLTAQDRVLQFSTLNFDGFVEQAWPTLCVGAALVLRGPELWDSETFYQALHRYRISLADLTTAYWSLLAQDFAQQGPRDYGALRQVHAGGEAMPPEALQAWRQAGMRHIRLLNTYGPTEAAVTAATLDCAPYLDGAAPAQMPIGLPLAGRALQVLDADLALTPPGAAGELCIGGALLARGYLGRPALTAERFVPDPHGAPGARLYRTGDLVRWRAGQLDYLGRIDQQIKIRGFRVELGEIEAQLLAQPGVREAVVVAQDSAAGARLVAYVSPAQVSVKALRVALAAALPDYMLPAAIVALARLPLNPAGKVARSALPVPVLESAAYAPPQGELEQALAAIWSSLLGVSRVGREDNFFALGGHSLLATRLVSRLRGALQCELPLRTVFATPTLAALAAAIGVHREEGLHAEALPALLPLPRSGAPMALSLAQQRLWLVERLAATASATYNMGATVRLTGPLQVPALQAALNWLVARHENLRSRYPEQDGDPQVEIAAQLQLDLPVTDLRHLPLATREAAAAEAVRADARLPFDLVHGPVLRASLLRMEDEQYLLLFAMHHMVADGWSVGILADELAHGYAAHCLGEAPRLPALPLQYADYAAWQRAVLDGPAGCRQAAFWREALAGAPVLLPLPLDFPRAPVASHAGAELRFVLPAALVARVEALARQQQATPFMVLLASFQWLLHRLTLADDIVIGTDVAGRRHSDLEGLIGFFVNVLPLRSRIAAGDDFNALLAQARRTTLDAFEHQELPFDRIVEAAGTPRDRRWNPLVQLLFVLQNTPAGQLAMPGIDAVIVPPLERSSKFDMALFLEPRADGALAAEWVYASALFRPDSVARLADAWLDLLDRALAAPATPLIHFSVPAHKDIMDSTPVTPFAAGKLDGLKKKMPLAGARPAPRAAIRQGPLQAGRDFPQLIEPASDDLDPVAWARGQREFIDATLRRHGGIVFRGFGLRTAQEFESFAEAIDAQLYGEYADLPKKEGGKKTYRSTPYPEQQMILFHNESAHLDRWPRKQWFFCELPSPVGGATPIVDCREMLRRLPAEVAETFERKQLMYVRTFTDKFDVSWRDFYRTDDRAEVEARCAAAGIECRWLENDTLQTRTICPAVIRHPMTGERSFFNQVQLHHIYFLEPEVREDLLAMVGIERMPRHVYYGDGTPIGDDVMRLVGELYEACAVRFAWQQGDVVMLDNMLAAHARDPFQGPRKIVVAMSELLGRAQLAQGGAA